MGFLSDGKTLAWQESKKHIPYVREHGVEQFLSVHRKVKDNANDKFLWGDEVEYIVVRVDSDRRHVSLSLRSHELLKVLQQPEREGLETDSLWRPEYGSFMVEGTPGKPYSAEPQSLCSVQANMKQRRQLVASLLEDDERLLMAGNFPMLGASSESNSSASSSSSSFSSSVSLVGGDSSASAYVSDDVICHHRRFHTLTKNIRERRQRHVDIRVPVFRDRDTKPPHNVYQGALAAEMAAKGADDESRWQIHMDAMAFGMGCCCLQTTYQCCNIAEARQFYDQLAVLSPIMLALSASTPIYRGYLSDIDVRWRVIAASVDDRTAEELGEAPLREQRHVINKSRYDSIDSYLSIGTDNGAQAARYSDLPLVMDDATLARLRDAGIDDLLSRHVAHLFIRDPLVIYEQRVEIDDEKDVDHFENIQSSNWQTVRFKPPPPGSDIGWRVEFRPIEVQLTDFENAAFSVFSVLLTRIIMAFNLDIYLPISKVDDNMRRAHCRNAVLDQRFHFRHAISGSSSSSSSNDDDEQYEQYSVDEIINGKEGAFVGLVPLARAYLSTLSMAAEHRQQIEAYLDLISKRASGKYLTAAAWIRNFVATHPDYKHDSIVSDTIAHDLLTACAKINNDELVAPELHGEKKLN
jgi:glutamate--cysteine ligase catalytic subunit